MINRELYMSRIRPFIGDELIKVITGLRRSGKSVMMELVRQELLASGIPKENVISYNFESMSYAHLRTAEALRADILLAVSALEGKVYLFFDELQEVAEWERCINSLRVELNCDIYITGSNAKLLSGELATYIAGRYVEFTIYPFSFAEFLPLYQTTVPSASARDAFMRYLTLGGMPYLRNLDYDEAPSLQYLLDLFNSVVLKDIVQRNGIRDVDLLQRIIAYVVGHVGTTFSASSITKYLKNEGRSVSAETVQNYIKACEDAFLLYRAKRQDIKGKKILAINEKYYIVDQGLREAIYGGGMRDINLVLENMVFMELLRRGYTITVGKVDENEIDFIGEKQGQKVYVQVSYLLASEETIRREFDVYSKVRDNFPKFVVSLDDIDMSREGIKHMNIRDFLLADSWD